MFEYQDVISVLNLKIKGNYMQKIIEQAVLDLYQKDKSLINDEVHEQTISARIMHYLQNALRGEWDIDVEYNRKEKTGIRKLIPKV